MQRHPGRAKRKCPSHDLLLTLIKCIRDSRGKHFGGNAFNLKIVACHLTYMGGRDIKIIAEG
jgi:hypothetical protein